MHMLLHMFSTSGNIISFFFLSLIIDKIMTDLSSAATAILKGCTFGMCFDIIFSSFQSFYFQVPPRGNLVYSLRTVFLCVFILVPKGTNLKLPYSPIIRITIFGLSSLPSSF